MLNTTVSAFESVKAEVIIRSVPLIENPLDWTTPRFDVFGVQFKSGVAVILGGIWGIVLLLCVGSFLLNLGRWGIAKKRGHSDDIEEGSEGAKKAAIALGAVAGAGVLVGFVLSIAGMIGVAPAAPAA